MIENEKQNIQSGGLPSSSIDLLDRRVSQARGAEEFQLGSMYRTKGDARFKDGSILKYCGKVQFNNELRFEFWSDTTRLIHWISPDKLEAV